MPVRVSSVFMPPLLGIGGIRFYPCLYGYMHPTFGFHSVLYDTNHLRFIHMVRNFKRQPKFEIFSCSAVMSLVFPKNTNISGFRSITFDPVKQMI